MEQVQSLRSGAMIQKKSQKIPLFTQHQLIQELRAAQMPTEAAGASAVDASTAIEDVAPTAGGVAPTSPTTHLAITSGPGDTELDTVVKGTLDTPEAEELELRVWELGRELQRPADRVIAVLRERTGTRFGWTPNDPVPEALVRAVRERLGGATPTGIRSAGKPTLAKAARTLVELNALRVQIFSDKATRGEKHVAEVLRGIDGCIAYVCAFLPQNHSSIEVDAIVISPTHLGVLEVKDTVMSGEVTTALNGPWLVDGHEMQSGGSSPAQQALRQARALGGCRKEHPHLRSMPRVPAFVAVHGSVQFERRPLNQVAETECFAFESSDTAAAIGEYTNRYRARVTVGQVLALMEVLDISKPLRMTREELGLLGFPEDLRAIG